MSVERLPMDRRTTVRTRSPTRLRPTSASVQVNKDSEIVELADRTGNASEISPPTGALPPNASHRTRARIQFASVCFSLFMIGWNDGTTGPLLPRIQKVYHVRELFEAPRQHNKRDCSGWLCHCSTHFCLFLYCGHLFLDVLNKCLHDFASQGFISGALLNLYISNQLGFGKVGRRFVASNRPDRT